MTTSSEQRLIRRLRGMVAKLRENRVSDRERAYLAAVLDHYHRTVAEWRNQ